MTKLATIIFDLDGTAINSPTQKLPSKRLQTVSQKLQKYYYLCVATGRSWTFAKDILQSLRLRDLSIIAGGTQICNSQTGEIVWQKNIQPKALSEVVKIFSENGDYKLIFNEYTEEDYFNGGIHPKDFDSNLSVNWMSQSFVPDDIALKLYEKLNSVEGIVCDMVVSQKPGCRDMHIVNSQATKEHAVAKILEILGADTTKTIGIGDGHNDIHLFNAVATKVAMGNAVGDLKIMADLEIGRVEDDGLAVYFEQLLAEIAS